MALPASPTKSSNRASPSLYHLDVRQQPRQARMAGSGEKADRRPIDPPPIIRLRIRRPHARKKPAHLLTDADLATPTLTHTLFMFASLVEEESEKEMFEVHGSKSALVAGSVVSSLFHLRDQSCFVFPDMSIRMEGRWRFKMSLYEVNEDGVEFCTSILTDVFQVYSSKRFPGMGKSTELSKSFAQQGLKLRIRRPGSKTDELEESPAPAPRLAHKFRAGRRESGPPAQTYAEPTPRHPSAPVASTSQSAVSVPSVTNKRPWMSWDAASGTGGPSHQPQLHPSAYGSYPPRSGSYGEHPPHPLDRPPLSAYDGFQARDPAAAYGSVPSQSGPHRTASSSYRTHVHPYGSLPPPAPLAHSHSYPHLRAHTFSHHALPAAAPYAHSNPQAHPHLHQHQHTLAQPTRRSPSPPPVLAPIRHPAPSGTAGAGAGRSTPTGTSSYSSAMRLSPPGPSGARPQTQAAESSLRSTDPGPVAPEPGPPRAGRASGSLAMLLGEGRDAKEVEGGDDGVVFH